MHLPSPEAVWTSTFDELCQRIEHCCIRQETRHRVQAYLRGLLSPLERKNGWQLAEEIGEAIPYGVQYLLDRAKWKEDAMRDELRAYVCAALADPQAVLILDETGFLKKGTKSLSENRNFGKDQLSTGKVKKSEVILRFLLPTYKKPT